MKIKWNDTFEIEIIDSFDEEMDNISESHNETVKEGETEDIDIIEDRGNYVDMQFGGGSMATCIHKSAFSEVK